MDIAKIRKKAKEAEEPSALREPAADAAVAAPIEMPAPPPEEAGSPFADEFRPPEDAVIELLTFSLGGEEYAFRVSDLQEIVRHQQISRVPRSAAFLLGISSLRGKIIPVIDLRELLLLRGEPADARRRKVLILKGPKGPLGAVVDRVVGVKRTRASAIGEAPAHLREAELRFIEGVVLIDNKFVSIMKTDEALQGDFFGERREGGGE